MVETKTVAERVAEACGWNVSYVTEEVWGVPKDFWTPRIDVNWKQGHGHEWIRDFSPYCNERHAVRSAEAYGLFFTERRLRLDWCPERQLWQAWTDADGTIGSGTFCEAICRAILWFEERK